MPAFKQLLVVAFLVAVTAAVDAHSLSVSYAQFSIGDRGIGAVVRIPLDDLDLLLRLDGDLDGQVSDAELAASRATLAGYVARHVTVDVDGAPMGASVDRVAFWRDPAGFAYVEIDAR